MRLLALVSLFAFLAPSAALAQKVGEVRRGPFRAVVRAQGTVVAEELSHIDSTIEGRIEMVDAAPGDWKDEDDDLATLATLELAAMLDAKSSNSAGIIKDRWQKVFKPNSVRCSARCYVTKAFAKPKKVVKPGAVLFEVAKKLRLIGRIRAGDAKWIREGQLLTFWDARKPGDKRQARVEKLFLDVQGQKVSPGASFSVLLSPKLFLPPGTEWEGEIVVSDKKSTLKVPTSALLRHGDEVFLPVRVSTGITTYEETEILSGVSERARFLLLDPDKMGALKSYEPEPLPPPDPKKEKPAKTRKERRPRAEEDEPEETEPPAEESGADYPSDLE
ncbi:MAG TPA: hypothetical protein DCM05_18130 [Elusimicrobia bacterium]|nr:hypothetical protein [Elusimicrobiota bacterium]